MFKKLIRTHFLLYQHMKPISSVFVLLLLLGALPSGAQITKRNLLQQFSEQTIAQSLIHKTDWKPFPKTPEEWRGKFTDSILNNFIKAGEIALKKEFKSIPATVTLEFVRTGNRSNYSKISYEKRELLWDLALAESIEGKGRFSDHMMDGIWSICEETFWGISAHLTNQKAGKGLPDAEDPIIDLFAAETASTLAWTDYFAGAALEKVSPLIRPRIKYEIERRIFRPMVTAKYFYLGRGNPEAKLNNWTPWIMSNYINAVLLIEDDDVKRVAGLKFAMKYIDQYINGLGEDGGCDEGPSYWFGAGGTVFDALNLLDNATNGKVNIFKEPFIQKMASYIYKTHISNEYFINVADAAPKLHPNGVMLYRFGKAIGDKKMMSFGSWTYHQFDTNSYTVPKNHRSRGLFDLIAIQECAKYPANYKNVSDVWLSDVQLMAARSKNGFFLASHGGHNGESHNHNDVGDFIIYLNGEPLIIDVGAGNYTARTFSSDRYKLWFNSSSFHNLPTINGYQQSGGTSYTATNVQYYSDDKQSSLIMDISKAYPAESEIKSWLRKVELNKKGNIKISDNYQLSNSPKSIAQSFMTVCGTDITKPGRIAFNLPGGENAFLDYNEQDWEVKKEKIELLTEEDGKFKSNWDGKDIWRILLIGKKNHQSGSSIYHIYH